jgi:hypothetical protein
MPAKQTIYDLKDPSGKVVSLTVSSVNAREILQSEPGRYTRSRPEGKEIVERVESATPPPEHVTDREREAAAERGRELLAEAAFVPEGTTPKGPIGGAGTIKGGQDLTRSGGMEVTRFESGEARFAAENPEEADEAEAERRPIQPLNKATESTGKDSEPKKRAAKKD